jgi:glycosyltransferase involved in cell wall biosynthesis
MAKVAIRTCRASTDAHMLVLANNSPDQRTRDEIKEECGLLGCRYEYLEGPFNIAKAFNHGTFATVGKYVAYGTSDVIYYPGWLDKIIAAWQQHPSYFALCNYSFDTSNNPCCRRDIIPLNVIKHTPNPSAGVIVLKRENGYQWDEQFSLWEIDADFLYYIEANNLKAGYCLNARCDHLVDGVKAHMDLAEAFGLKEGEDFYRDSKAKIRAKWKDRYKG